MKVLPRLVARSDHAVEELALELVQLLLHLKCKYFNVMPHLKYSPREPCPRARIKVYIVVDD